MKKVKPIKTHTVFQMEMTECGAASLSMVMGYYGVHIPLEQLRIDTGVSRDGCKASKILVGAKKYGFNGKGIKLSLDKLLKQKPPCIIHWNFNHFLVYEGFKNNKIYLNDPAEGRRVVSIDEADKSFTGIELIINPTEETAKIKNTRTFLDLVKGKINGHIYKILFVLVFGLISSIPGILIPIISQIFIDKVLVLQNFNNAHTMIFILIFLAFFKCIYLYQKNFLLIKLQDNMSLTSIYSFTQHLFKMPISFFKQRYTADLVNRVKSNHSISAFFTSKITETSIDIIISIIYICVMYIYSPILTLICMIVIISNLMILKYISNNISQLMSKVQQDNVKLQGVLYGGVTIIDSLRALGSENKYVSRILGYYSKVISIKQEHENLRMISASIPNIMKLISEILITIVGGYMVIDRNLTIGTVVAFSSIFKIMFEPIGKIAGFVEEIQKVNIEMQRLEDVTIQPKDFNFVESQQVLKEPKKIGGDIKVKNLVFGYSLLEDPLIENFNFEISCGKSIAIVGGSGSGKSTIAKIISGLYEPWSGEILFDNINNTSIPSQIKSLSITTVNQEIFVFKGTVKDNITMYNDNIMVQDVIRAAKDAEIHDIITKKNDAYNHMLDERGNNLSGGEKQRIEIARALVINPSIIIMDEATSALDAITEKNILNNIKRRGCTTVIVAHRLSAIRDCDEIIVMKKGKIVERGNYSELMRNKSQYYDMYVNEG